MKSNKFLLIGFILLGLISVGAKDNTSSQVTGSSSQDLRSRVTALEVSTRKLQASMNEFSTNLVKNLDQQLQAATTKTVVLEPLSRKVTKIETNTGMFLVSVQRLDKIDKGYRLYLQIGNPNAATYGDAKIRVYWGGKWDPNLPSFPYDKWRQSLAGAEFVYSGSLEAGTWTDIAVDLKPAEFSQVQHIECEMEVNTVKLQKLRNFDSDVAPANR